jgi:hypothetical protein
MKTSFKLLLISFSIALTSFYVIKTQLTLTVRNELGNTEDNVKVQLFENEDDYQKEANVAAEGMTDEKGIVKFKELKPISYYVIARKDDKDNSGGGEQVKLEANKINKATVIIQ